MRSRSAREKSVTEHVSRLMARHSDRVWTRNELAQVLADALLATGFDWHQRSALEEVKRLLLSVYRIAWRTVPAERLRLGDGAVDAARSRASKEISL